MISLLECLDLIQGILGRNVSEKLPLEIMFQEGHFGDLRYFVTNYEKFQQATGWQPKLRPLEGVTKLVDWIQAHPTLFLREDLR